MTEYPITGEIYIAYKLGTGDPVTYTVVNVTLQNATMEAAVQKIYEQVCSKSDALKSLNLTKFLLSFLSQT